jgi:hypothetical protein
MYGDQFSAQYGKFNSPLFNVSNGGTNTPTPFSVARKVQSNTRKKSGSKVGSNFNKSGLSTIYTKKHDELDFGFGSKTVRISFMRKIYIILTIQLGACFGLVYFASISYVFLLNSTKVKVKGSVTKVVPFDRSYTEKS